jgi:Protein-L-isoaspartate(D-aspartate) O-methyltransferase (PCMT)
MPAPSPLPDENGRAFSREEARRGAARLCAADAGGLRRRQSGDRSRLRRRAARGLPGPPPWTASSPFGGTPPLPGADPVVLYQALVVALDPARGVNNPPALHPKLIEALGPKQGEGIVHVGAGAGYSSAILAELVDPAAQVTAVEFDAALAKRAKALSGRPNVRVICDDGARCRKPRPTGFTSVLPWRGRPIAGSKACLRAAGSSSRSVCLAPSGRIAAAGTATAARRFGSNGAATPTRRALSAWPILSAPRENSRLIPKR